MTQVIGIVAAGLLAIGLLGETKMPESEGERQPGLLHVSGINDDDRVLLDGELIGDGKRIMRFGGKLLLNPGDYVVTVMTTDNQQACSSTISIRENAIAVATCRRPSSLPEQDVD